MSSRRDHDPTTEEATDALVDGDRTLATGTAVAALRHRDFRVVWAGTFASNIGTWMQNVLLGAFALQLTHDASYVGLVYFAQLGPLLFLAPLGGTLADILDRRKLLIWMQLEQVVFSIVLAVLAASPNPNRWAIFGCVLLIGIGNALSGPAISALLPTLVPREDLPGAVSLQSVQMNLSRVIGPAIGAPLYALLGVGTVFGLNAATYGFAIASLIVARYPPRHARAEAESPLRRFLSGFRLAAADPLIRRILITMTTFSFFSLTFVGLMPEIAEANFDIGPKSIVYGLLYATFGLGAALGAVTVGTYLAHRSKAMIARRSLVAFAAVLAVFALVRNPALAFPVAFVLGFVYFMVITALSISLQQHLDDAIRGRIMALWIMAFGGVVPLGVLAGGALVGVTTITVVMLVGAVVALGLAWYCDLAAVGAPD
ncbi:MAG TPA: MFS transporter [Acidimicrobiia bacterium]|jgi:MFS family permease